MLETVVMDSSVTYHLVTTSLHYINKLVAGQVIAHCVQEIF